MSITFDGSITFLGLLIADHIFRIAIKFRMIFLEDR